MISCRMFARLLLGFVEKELPTEHRELVEEHLLSCPQCVAFADSYQAVIRLGRHLPQEPLPPEMQQFLEDSLSKENLRSPEG